MTRELGIMARLLNVVTGAATLGQASDWSSGLSLPARNDLAIKVRPVVYSSIQHFGMGCLTLCPGHMAQIIDGTLRYRLPISFDQYQPFLDALKSQVNVSGKVVSIPTLGGLNS